MGISGMGSKATIGLAVVLLLSGTSVVVAQGSAGTGAANNGIGQQGSLTANNGTHASTSKGPAAAARIPISPRPTTPSRNDPKIENEPALGGGNQH
jgi:hypothetical protein